MNVSVIIPALNEEETIRGAVESAWAAGADEVVVADGGSIDATLQIAAAAGASSIESARGRGIQQNAGAREARGETLLFLHADSRLGEQCLVQIDAAFAAPSVVAGAFRQRITESGWSYRLLEYGNAARARWLGLPFGDQGIFVRRDVFVAAGGFPEEPILEEVGLWKRLRRHGRPVLLPGPLFVSARRWLEHGIIRQTTRNWCLLLAHALGASPQRLAGFYRTHRERA